MLSLSIVGLLRKEMLPLQDIGLFIIRVETPTGSSLAFTNGKLVGMEKILQTEPSIDHYFVNGGGFEGGESNRGMAFVSLKDHGARQETQQPGHG